MTRISLFIAVSIGAFGCSLTFGPDTATSKTAVAAAIPWESCLSIPPTPTCPQRLDLADWQPGRRFYPTADTASAITIVMQNPEDPSRFWAIGFDVRQLNCVFYVDGNKQAHYADFSRQVLDDVLEIRRLVLADFIHGSDGDTEVPPPPLPDPSIEPAFKAAYVTYSAIEAWRH